MIIAHTLWSVRLLWLHLPIKRIAGAKLAAVRPAVRPYAWPFGPSASPSVLQEDWIGLKALNESNRLVIGQSPGGHMQFSLQWLEQHVIVPYLSQASAIVHQYAL